MGFARAQSCRKDGSMLSMEYFLAALDIRQNMGLISDNFLQNMGLISTKISILSDSGDIDGIALSGE